VRHEIERVEAEPQREKNNSGKQEGKETHWRGAVIRGSGNVCGEGRTGLSV
jgi:hypothetical protein